ncbi:Nucleoside phosphatase GDA1/CD39 [Quillaja saponaria]|uniref:Nucleoside phosphatase GDA1/CD39 n=1 Tax=Quillaja saponaria TaxID=32244 RepID=A0AAD7L973_QUISA|nr:Nucleoside phosphatase GDA1/CD39 [Quillaja saponaria]
MRRSNARTRVDSKSKQMDPIKLQIRPSSRPNLFARNSKTTKSNYMAFASIFIALAFFLCYLFVFGRNSQNIAKKKYGIVIDGGSTGTRIHVFKYKVESGNAVFDFVKDGLASMRVNPGLSSYGEEPNGAGESLAELLEFGKGRVPKENWGDTEIRLMATAGLRMLELGVQERILESCRRVLRSSGFKFRDEWASVIKGSDEGIYAWVIANYALGTLGGDPLPTLGIIELGGASAQVTFVSSEPMPSEFSHAVRFGNTTYNLYSHSFLQFGQNVAFDSLREALISGDVKLATKTLQKGLSIDPCIPKGYSHNVESWNLSPGSLGINRQSTLQTRGNFTECRSAALMLLQKGKEKCSYQHCYLGSTFMPKLQGKFLATENFFYTSKFFGLEPRAFLSDLMIAGQQFCEEDWPKLKKKYQSLDEEDLLRYCFSSSYIVAMLHDSLGVALDDERIVVSNQVGSIPLDWALGAFILQSMADLNVQQHTDWIATFINDDSPTLLSLIGILIILMFTAWSVSWWRKTQLKTIYDLEKGRYIVTQVGRSW